MNYVYLRVSSLQQDEEMQRVGVDNLAKTKGLTIHKYVIDKVSGAKEPDERNLGKLLKKVKKGDIIIVSEISRLGRKLFMIIEIMKLLLEKGVKLYSVKDNFELADNIQSKVLIFAFGLSSEIERNLIAARTREALNRLKMSGRKLGRPLGSKSSYSKLDSHKTRLINDYHRGYSKTYLAKRYKVSIKTVRKYINMYENDF